MNEHRKNVQKYYDLSTSGFLEFSTTIQSSPIISGREITTKISNLYFLIRRAGIKPGYRVLDAGCGVCGPSIDLALMIDNIEIHAITISSVQVQIAKSLLRKNNLSRKIVIYKGDFHHLPFTGQSFDVVYFLESACYSDDLEQLFSAVYRVLRPGGTLFIKDFFMDDNLLTDHYKEVFRNIDSGFATSISSLDNTLNAIINAKFNIINVRDIIDITHSIFTSEKTYYKIEDGFFIPNRTRGFKFSDRIGDCKPIFGEIIAKKPIGIK